MKSLIVLCFCFFIFSANAQLLNGLLVDLSPSCATLNVGTVVAGSVCVIPNNATMSVTYTMNPGYCMTSLSLWTGLDAALIPLLNGLPLVSAFPIQVNLTACLNMYQLSVAVPVTAGLSICSQSLNIATQVNLNGQLDLNNIVQTAWSAGLSITGSIETYTPILINCLISDVLGLVQDLHLLLALDVCETAYAYGDVSFLQLGVTGPVGGSQITVQNGASVDASLYVGLLGDLLGAANLVGSVSINQSGANMTVCFNTLLGYLLDTVNVFADITSITDLTIDSFTTSGSVSLAVNNTCVTVAVDPTAPTFYVVAQANVCLDVSVNI